MTESDWRPDVLGDDFDACALPIISHQHRAGETPADALGAHQPGRESGAYATLVRYRPGVLGREGEPRPLAVLYLHGFNDYFFQTHLAETIAATGAAFYAVDLRGFGRSLAAHIAVGGDPNLLPDVSEHARDLDAAVARIRAEGHREIVVLAHSMGGLIASRWAAARPGQIAGLILNSPWFDLNENALLRGPGTQLIGALGTVAPRVIVGGLHPYYARALHRSSGGEWDFKLDWKPIDGFPVRARWITSIRKAQAGLNAGIDTGVPTLVLSSDRTGSHVSDHPDLLSTDSVLNVEHIKAGAAKLGPRARYQAIPGGAHDLALSAGPARSQYFDAVVGWLREHFGPELDG